MKIILRSMRWTGLRPLLLSSPSMTSWSWRSFFFLEGGGGLRDSSSQKESQAPGILVLVFSSTQKWTLESSPFCGPERVDCQDLLFLLECPSGLQDFSQQWKLLGGRQKNVLQKLPFYQAHLKSRFPLTQSSQCESTVTPEYGLANFISLATSQGYSNKPQML